MSEEEFIEARDNIKDIYTRIDVTQMYDNPDFGALDIVQLPMMAHTYVKDLVWDFVNPDLFAIFWLLSVDNIYVPIAIYDKQIKQI